MENKNLPPLDPFVTHFIDSSFQTMQTVIRSGDEVVPQVLLFARGNGEKALFPLIGIERYFQSKESKRLIRLIVQKAWNESSYSKPHLGLVAVFMLSDVWVEKPPLDEVLDMIRNGRKTPFTPKPGMEETLLIQVSLADREMQCHWPYFRADDGIFFAPKPTIELIPDDSPTALLMRLWPENSKKM